MQHPFGRALELLDKLLTRFLLKPISQIQLIIQRNAHCIYTYSSEIFILPLFVAETAAPASSYTICD